MLLMCDDEDDDEYSGVVAWTIVICTVSRGGHACARVSQECCSHDLKCLKHCKMHDSQPAQWCERVRGWCDRGARGGARGVLSEAMAHKPRAGKASWIHTHSAE